MPLRVRNVCFRRGSKLHTVHRQVPAVWLNHLTATMGETAAGIAHELEQPLAAISLYAEGCLSAVASPSATQGEISSKLHDIARLSNRCSQIIDRLQRFASRHESPRAPVDLREVVETVLALADSELRSSGIPCRASLPDQPLQDHEETADRHADAARPTVSFERSTPGTQPLGNALGLPQHVTDSISAQ